ncbi:MAG: PAN/Apple domain-containing protein [Hyphomonadaceae bacterium]
MRMLSVLALLLLAQIGAAWAIGDLNTARPGGAFSTVEAESAGACERLCVEDRLCMAWSFSAARCELKAIVPPALPEQGAVSGVSPRAPASTRPAPPLRQAARVVPSAANPAPRSAPETNAQAAAAAADISDQLLGGLEAETGLRARLGN